jgi:hypothetical protein
MGELGRSPAFAWVLPEFPSIGSAGPADIAVGADRPRFGEGDVFTQDAVNALIQRDDL